MTILWLGLKLNQINLFEHPWGFILNRLRLLMTLKLSCVQTKKGRSLAILGGPLISTVFASFFFSLFCLFATQEARCRSATHLPFPISSEIRVGLYLSAHICFDSLCLSSKHFKVVLSDLTMLLGIFRLSAPLKPFFIILLSKVVTNSYFHSTSRCVVDNTRIQVENICYQTSYSKEYSCYQAKVPFPNMQNHSSNYSAKVGKCETFRLSTTFPEGDRQWDKKNPNVTGHKIEKIKKRTQENKNLDHSYPSWSYMT